MSPYAIEGARIEGARKEPDPRPYHERRAEMPHCPECLSPDCYSLVCDEPATEAH